MRMFLYLNLLDLLTIIQAFEVKAVVDQTNREIMVHFSFMLTITLRLKPAANKCHNASF